MIKIVVTLAVSALVSAGIANADPSSDTVALKEVCRMLETASPDEVVEKLMREHGGSLQTDRVVVVAAIDSYCPNHTIPEWGKEQLK
jgi:Protein of unknown function (DUF732)